MSRNARRFAAAPRSAVRSADAMEAAILDLFGQDAPAVVTRRGPVAYGSFEYERSLYCCEDCDGPYVNFLRNCERWGIEVPATEWAAVAAREEQQRRWEIDQAYRELHDQLCHEAGMVKEWWDTGYYRSDREFDWVMPGHEKAEREYWDFAFDRWADAKAA